MFRSHLHLSVLATVALLVAAASAEEIDLARVERTILREPMWQSKTPKYCLFVVSAEKRVWFVVDGDDLYMDINGNGDLTEPNEKLSRLNLSPEERRETKNYSVWRIPEIAGADGLPVKNISMEPDTNRGAAPGTMMVYFEVADRSRAFVRPNFAASAKDAPIIHPTGPVRLSVQTRELLTTETGADGVRMVRPTFSVTGQCYVQGLGPGTDYLTATPDLRCKMEFPLADGKTDAQEMALTYYTDWGIYRSNSTKIPFDVVDGNVRITVSVAEPRGKSDPKPVVIEKKVAGLGGARRRAKRSSAESAARAKSARPERPVPVREALLTFKGGKSLAFSPDGKRLAVTDTVDNPNSKLKYKYATVVKLLDATTGEETLRLPPFTGLQYQRVVFSSDGKRLAASNATTAMVWDATSGQELLKLEGLERVTALALSPDGKLLAHGSPSNRKSSGSGHDGTVKVVDATSGEERLTLKQEADNARLGVSSLAFSPDGTRLATVSKDTTLTLWDTTNGDATLTMNRDNRYDSIGSVAFSADGTRLAVAHWDQTVSVWNATSGEEMLRLKGHFHSVSNVAFSPDGKQLATAGGRWPNDLKPGQLPTEAFVRLWDAASGEETLRLKGHSRGINSLAFSPDGRRLVATERYTEQIKVWDVSDRCNQRVLR